VHLIPKPEMSTVANRAMHSAFGLVGESRYGKFDVGLWDEAAAG
jgi:hypothetical protein